MEKKFRADYFFQVTKTKDCVWGPLPGNISLFDRGEGKNSKACQENMAMWFHVAGLTARLQARASEN